VKREYQQDTTIQMFIVNFRCLLLTTVSTCFGHDYTHHQEKKRPRITAYGVSAGGGAAVVGRCVVGCEHSAGNLQRNAPQLQPATSSTTSANTISSNTRSLFY